MPGGVVHKLPEDLRKALVANPAALAAWMDTTPLGRNEFICWVEDAKQRTTRDRLRTPRGRATTTNLRNAVECTMRSRSR